jgi:hypothetical protein
VDAVVDVSAIVVDDVAPSPDEPHPAEIRSRATNNMLAAHRRSRTGGG